MDQCADRWKDRKIRDIASLLFLLILLSLPAVVLLVEHRVSRVVVEREPKVC